MPNHLTVGSADEIGFIQNVRVVDLDTGVNRAANGKNRLASDLWHVDRLDGKDQGWYGMSDEGTSTKKKMTLWQKSDWREPAWMKDVPSRSKGNIQFQAETAIVCSKGFHAGKVYATVHWGFEIDKNLVVTPYETEVYNKETEAFDDAVDAWNTQATGPSAAAARPPSKSSRPTSNEPARTPARGRPRGTARGRVRRLRVGPLRRPRRARLDRRMAAREPDGGGHPGAARAQARGARRLRVDPGRHPRPHPPAAMRDRAALNDFGYIDEDGGYDREAGFALLELGDAAVEPLAEELDDANPGQLEGSEEATLTEIYGLRRADFAYRFLARILGVEPEFDADPAVRDTHIAALRKRAREDSNSRWLCILRLLLPSRGPRPGPGMCSL